MEVKFYTDKAGDWRWKVVSANGSDVLGDSGQGYSRRVDAVAGFWAIIDGANAAVVTFNGEPGDLRG